EDFGRCESESNLDAAGLRRFNFVNQRHDGYFSVPDFVRVFYSAAGHGARELCESAAHDGGEDAGYPAGGHGDGGRNGDGDGGRRVSGGDDGAAAVPAGRSADDYRREKTESHHTAGHY